MSDRADSTAYDGITMYAYPTECAPHENLGADDISNVYMTIVSKDSRGDTTIAPCMRCGARVPYVGKHLTTYSEGRACFPLCKECWSECTPQQRLPFYSMLWALWVAQTPQDMDNLLILWWDIRKAVMDGK